MPRTPPVFTNGTNDGYSNKQSTDGRLDYQYSHEHDGIDRSLAFRDPLPHEVDNNIFVLHEKLRVVTRKLVATEQENVQLKQDMTALQKLNQVSLYGISLYSNTSYYSHSSVWDVVDGQESILAHQSRFEKLVSQVRVC